MRIDWTTIVFFDASCLVAAAGSPKGGSGFLLTLVTRRLLTGAVSQPVLVEAERNVAEQLPPGGLTAYYQLLQTTPLRVLPVPRAQDLEAIANLANPKDTHVIASAVAASAEFLVTLDKRLMRELASRPLPFQVLSPGAFITAILPQHIDYPSIR